jgi:hypothetical protein
MAEPCSVTNPIYLKNILQYTDYDKVCWAEVGYRANTKRVQACNHIMEKYLGKYKSHTLENNMLNVVFENGMITQPTHADFTTIFVTDCNNQSGGRRRNRKTKKTRKNRKNRSLKRK